MLRIAAVIGIVLLGAAVPAHAEDPDEWDDEPYTRDTWPSRILLRPLTPAARMVELETILFIDATAGYFAKPVALIPSLFLGVTDRLAFGITHLRGLCLTGVENGCPSVYDDIAAEARYALVRRARFELVAGGGPSLQEIGGPVLDLVVRVVARGRLGPAALLVEPFVRLALTGENNVHILGVALRPQVQIGDRVALVGYTALFGAADDLDGTVTIPVGIGARVALGRVDVGAQLTFPNLLGRNQFAEIGLSRTDRRELLVSATARF